MEELRLNPDGLAPEPAFSPTVLYCVLWPAPICYSQPLVTDGNVPLCSDLALVNNSVQNQSQIHYLGVRTFNKLMQITFTDPTADIPLLHVCSSHSPWEEKPCLSSTTISHGLWKR